MQSDIAQIFQLMEMTMRSTPIDRFFCITVAHKGQKLRHILSSLGMSNSDLDVLSPDINLSENIFNNFEIEKKM